MADMDKQKLAVIAGIAAVLFVVFMLLRAILSGGDSVQPQFHDALIAQQTVIELSNIAIRQSESTELRNRASIISSSVGSDFNSLGTHYSESFGSPPRRSTEKAAIDELRAAREGFDALYREMVLDYLRISRDRMESLQNHGNQEFREALASALRNHQHHIDVLTR